MPGCLSSGRYCAPQAGPAYQVDFPGKAVVWETLRQVAIFDKYSLKQYFTYLLGFTEQCLDILGTFKSRAELEACVATPLQMANISKSDLG